MSNDCLICEPILLDPKLAYIERDYILLFYYTLFVESFDTSPYGQCLLQCFTHLPTYPHAIWTLVNGLMSTNETLIKDHSYFN